MDEKYIVDARWNDAELRSPLMSRRYAFGRALRRRIAKVRVRNRTKIT